MAARLVSLMSRPKRWLFLRIPAGGAPFAVGPQQEEAESKEDVAVSRNGNATFHLVHKGLGVTLLDRRPCRRYAGVWRKTGCPGEATVKRE